MSSWVLCISKGHESHWSIAVENGFWDLTQFRSIVAGDTVYFWQAGQSFLAMSRATTDASRLAGTEDRPWEDERKYTCRFQFDVVSAAPFAAPRWQQVKALLKTDAGLNTKPKFTDPRQQALLTTYFLPDDWADRPAIETVIASAPSDIIPSSFDHDGRRRAPVERVVREGREKFKSGLLSAYSGACPLTGCSEDKVLEGAHISEYRGPQTNDLRNGLPLRVDVHRLFDSHLMAIDGNLIVHVHPSVQEPVYRDLDGMRLRAPSDPLASPSPELLQKRFDFAQGRLKHRGLEPHRV